MISDFVPIKFKTDPSFDDIEIYLAHDIHVGSETNDMKKWDRFKQDVLSEPNRYIIFCGDYCENAVVGSKSDIYTQTVPPAVQKEWFTQQLIELSDRTIAVIPGNHEDNRITKLTGLFPIYDCAFMAGIADRYRQHFAFMDIAVGSGGHGYGKQVHYIGFATHKMKDCKSYSGSDFVDGIDFALYGHDHCPKDQARSKLRYCNGTVVQRDVEVLNSGSFMSFGGYGASSGFRPQSSKVYKMILSGSRKKGIQTVGFHI